ncbi:c-type cytochrome [Modicisalibacter coralii]|uniref:c-type cytochrome n=1 Tax=Modicisalibacter coralii TaxID=2304602 RepID=UPI00100C0828|nr:cytochrome c [Halomonas coralii]
MFKMVLGGIITMLLLITGGATVVFSGIYNVAATEEHLPFVEPILHSTMHASVEAGAEDIEVPDLNSDSMIQAGAKAYNDLCVACHLKPGLESTVLRAGLNPLPPTFSESAHQNPAQQFWIIKNGIKMTGMPSWGATHDDEELWELVAFLQEMPSLSEPQYNALVSGERQGMALASNDAPPAADDGHDHEHGDMGGMTMARDAHDPATADDGHDHEHGDMSPMANAHGESAPEPRTADDGHDHEHGDMSAMTDTHQEQEAEPATADDGHDHEHGDMSDMTAQDTTSHDDGHENHDH